MKQNLKMWKGLFAKLVKGAILQAQSKKQSGACSEKCTHACRKQNALYAILYVQASSYAFALAYHGTLLLCKHTAEERQALRSPAGHDWLEGM